MARKYRHFVYDERQRFIYPTSDWGFKYLLGTEANKDILVGILQKLLPEMGIVSLEYLPRDITIPVGKMRDASFDVHCKLRDGSRMVVEMQNYVRGAFLDRSLIYSSAAVLEHYVNSHIDGYSIGKTVFLAFLGDPLFRQIDRTPVRIGLCDIDSEKTSVLNDKLLQIFVELPKFAGSLTEISEDTPFIEKLSIVLMEMADCKEIPQNLGDPLLERMFKAADMKTMDINRKSDYMKSILGEAEYEAQLHDWREEGLVLGREEGRVEGRALGLKEGREEGRMEGREEGRTEGREEGRMEGREEERLKNVKAMEDIVRKLKEMNLSVEEISNVTGIPVDSL